MGYGRVRADAMTLPYRWVGAPLSWPRLSHARPLVRAGRYFEPLSGFFYVPGR
jgi:hypothetical protein